MPFEEEIKNLNLFITKVKKLTSLSLVRSLIENGSELKLSGNKETQVLQIDVKGPNSEQIDAFVLTMRLFMQDNDRISIRNTSKLIAGLAITDQLKQYYENHRNQLNSYLDTSSMVVISQEHPTRRDILETVLYGELSHLEPARKKRYEIWTANSIMKPIINFEFVGIITMFLKTLSRMAEICKHAIAELQPKQN